jgi:flagellar motor switch protein FliM
MSDILSQEEVDALLKGVSDGHTPGEAGDFGSRGIRDCDLTNQERTLYGRMPGLDRIFEVFVRGMRSSVEALLGDIAGLSLAGVELIRYGTWAERLPVPLSVHMFRLTPLNGNGLVILSPPLSAAALEMAFGGKARRQAVVDGREYSEIETRVLQRFVMRVLEAFQDAWQSVHPLDLCILRSESNPAHATIATEDAVVLIAELRVLLEGEEGLTLSLCIPYAALDPVRNELSGEVEGAKDERSASWDGVLRGRITDLPLAVRAELGSCQMSMRDVMALKPGDVLTLDTRREGAIVLRVEDLAKFLGVPGVSRDGHAVRIVDRIVPGAAGLRAA